jgi:hypothetical protein
MIRRYGGNKPCKRHIPKVSINYNHIVAFPTSSKQTSPRGNFANKIANIASLFFLFPKSSSILFGNPIIGVRTAKVLTDEVLLSRSKPLTKNPKINPSKQLTYQQLTAIIKELD